MLDDQEPKDGFAGGGMTTVDERQGIARAQVGTNLAVELIILQETVQLLQEGIGVLGKFWDSGKHVFIGIAIDEHGCTGDRGTWGTLSRILAPPPQLSTSIFPLFCNSN